MDLAQINIAIFIFIGLLSSIYIVTRYLQSFIVLIFFSLSFLILGIINGADYYYAIYDAIRIFSCIATYLAGFCYFYNNGSKIYIEILRFSILWTIIFYIILFIFFAVPYLQGTKLNLSLQLDPLPFIIWAIIGKGSMVVAIAFSILTYKRMFFISTLTVSLFHYLINKQISFLQTVIIAILIILSLFFFLPLLPKYISTINLVSEMLSGGNSFIEVLTTLSSDRYQELEFLINNYSLIDLLVGQGFGGGVISRFGNDGQLITSSFIHISIISLILKLGFFGSIVLIFSFISQYVRIRKRSGFSREFIIISLYGFVCSIFASYFLVSAFFWFFLGGIAAIEKESNS